jgi:hypothetical protein
VSLRPKLGNLPNVHAEISRATQEIAEHVITILINLSSDREILESLAADDKFLETILSYIVVSEPLESSRSFTNLLRNLNQS